MPRLSPSPAQDFLSSVILPLLSIFLLPISFLAVAVCVLLDKLRGGESLRKENMGKGHKGCVMISGGRMTKGLTLARAFKRAGWKVIGVEEEGWGNLCPMRFSRSVDKFHLLPPASQSYSSYSSALLQIAHQHSVTLFIPVSGAGSSIEDSRAADQMFISTKGKCRTFIQDPETMEDLHDKDKFVGLVGRLGMSVPMGILIKNVNEGMEFLKEKEEQDGREPRYILKCLGLDENRGDMTLFPLKGDDEKMSRTRKLLDGLRLKISEKCPYVFQEFIPGQEWCTHASVIDGQITSFVTCPSNDMLMTYSNSTTSPIGLQAYDWTARFLSLLKDDPTPTGKKRNLTGHFSFDFILSTRDGKLYPLECNARVHTAVIMLPLDSIAGCYDSPSSPSSSFKNEPLRPKENTRPRSWIYNDLIMRYLPYLVSSPRILSLIHPSLPPCSLTREQMLKVKPNEDPWLLRVDPTLVADDWLPFIILWHVWWPSLLLSRWWQGKKWTRLNVSTGRIFEC